MTVLAVDTATLVASAALVDRDCLLAETNLMTGQTHSRTLLPEIDRLLKENSLTVDRLEFLAVGLGPGSFTGLRIGLAAAKGLAWAAKKPLIGVPTLDAMVLNLPPGGRTACPMVDARKDQVYAALYDRATDGVWSRRSDFLSIAPDLLAGEIEQETTFFGQGLEKYGRVLSDTLGSLFKRGPVTADYPRAANVARLAYELRDQGAPEDPALVVPLYVRPPDIRKPKNPKKGQVFL